MNVIVSVRVVCTMYLYNCKLHVVECRGFESHLRQLGKVTALGVLCCFALLFV